MMTDAKRLRLVPGVFFGTVFFGTIAMSLALSVISRADGGEPGEKLQYNRDVRPILADNCFTCHGPDSAARKAELRLDQREAAIEAGAVAAGNPDVSELIRRIESTDPDELMPPPSTTKTLSAQQKDVLRRWISEGAEYQSHWSLIAPHRPTPPAVRNAAWIRNSIDSFVLAKLEASGLQPAPEADRRALARRLSLDLTGLPPSPDLAEEFVHDSSPDAYEKLVDTLLDSAEWGEHRARYWLDAARYADTHGIHFDNYREIWAYRDWVIKAFNRNLPFDQFTIEQLGGDLFPNPTPDQRIATGFNRCNITTNEGGVIPEEYLVLYTRDRTETVSQVWLGLTANCAVCHDHKFDPLTQREFYGMAAFFNNTTQAAMDGNIKDTPPVVVVPTDEDRSRWSELRAQVPQVRQQVETRRQLARADFDNWLAAATPAALGNAIPGDVPHVHAALNEGQGKLAQIAVEGQPREVRVADAAAWQPGVSSPFALQVQGQACELSDVADFEKDQPFTCTAWIKLPANDSHGAICARMDDLNVYRGWDFWVQDRHVGTHVIHAWPDDALKVVGKAQIPSNEWTHVAVTCDGSAKAAGVTIYYNGQPQQPLVEADRLISSVRTAVPLKIGQRYTSDPLSGAVVQDLRIYKRVLTAVEIESMAKMSRLAGILRQPAVERTDADKNEVYPWWLARFDATFQALDDQLDRLLREEEAIKTRSTIAHVMDERNEPATAYILFRGEYDKRRDPVQAETPHVLPPLPPDYPRNRLGFARWLMRPEHPLTARVAVNRFWQEIFGTGIVRTAGDFGVAGEPPSHPELLDWLAIEFRESGWDVKRFFKLLVTSAAYRQAAVATAEKLEKDPQNRLVSRGPRFRMDGEMVRDYALAASGLLVPKLGGPSVKPYQPDGVWEAVAMIGSNTRDYRRDSGEALYRRSLYTFWKRSAPPASLDIFNAPSHEVCAVRRERTNTPLQALVTLNDTQFVEAARQLAQQALLQCDESTDARLDFIARRLLIRPLRAEELAVVKKSLGELSSCYLAQPDDATRLIAVGESKAAPNLDPSLLAAWTMLVNQLMNLDEVLNK